MSIKSRMRHAVIFNDPDCMTLCVWQLQQGLTYFTNEGQSLAVAGIGADSDGTRLVQ